MFSNMFVTLETDILTLNEGEFHELPCSDNEDDDDDDDDDDDYAIDYK